jgi:hypothetical protein
MSVRVRIVQLIGCSIVLASGCEGRLDNKDLEDTLRLRMAPLGSHTTGITCPPDVDARPGKTFTCEVAVDATHRYALNVTPGEPNHATGKVHLDTRWRDGEGVQTAKVAVTLSAELSKSVAAEVVVTCGDEPVRFLDAKRQLTCAVSAGEAKSVVTIDFDAALVATHWQLSPGLLSRARLEEGLTPQVRSQTTADTRVDCGPAAFFVRPADGAVWCTISSAGRKATIKVDVDEKLNGKSWKFAEPPG